MHCVEELGDERECVTIIHATADQTLCFDGISSSQKLHLDTNSVDSTISNVKSEYDGCQYEWILHV